ncbi:MAG: SAM-dependent methyltransferase [Sulfolobales archaeon]|nr:SAM-dependent methyltransferase [Sulfolobales archaeon]
MYGQSLELLLESLKYPGSRMYVRVNTMKTEPGALVDRLRERGIEVFRDEELAEAVYFRVEGPFTVSTRDRVVVAVKEAAESVALGANLYAPGVLKCYNVKKGDEVTVVTKSGIPVAEGVVVRDCHEAKSSGRGLVVEVHRSLYRATRIRELPEFAEGLIYPQSLPAMYVARQLELKPGEVVVDLCASPGGKTGHVVELSRGRVAVVAFDRSRSKVDRMREELSRLGHARYVQAWVADSRYVHLDYPWLRADEVIVDPPCSALGVRPKLEDRKKYEEVLALKKYQLQFLKAASRIVKPGGSIVYSTCTVTLEENEEVVEELLNEEPCLDVNEVRVERASRSAYGKFKDVFTRFHPHVHDTPGYFIAKIARKLSC